MTGFHAALDPGEATIARARIRARLLANRLSSTLVDRALYVELQQFLDDVGFRACDALEELSERSDPALRHRLHLVLGIGSAEDCS
ncbi:hypothetical protein QRX50_20195 [Amycolatopsis carbonis]|uniref:Uncharacterized protein n=1 Tax=Amycolatopsis carbonis TaxID=715471 RepID=A0A9Y2IN09_9PSEU|nr:hypothetical protein [Amycolatopsis sp. 2-15]WIX82919.1 hypothetical protein QRX50_20195 [Amycolatopsis sp. 2-15]